MCFVHILYLAAKKTKNKKLGKQTNFLACTVYITVYHETKKIFVLLADTKEIN